MYGGVGGGRRKASPYPDYIPPFLFLAYPYPYPFLIYSNSLCRRPIGRWEILCHSMITK
jgi:hypothetical protein